MRFEGTVRPASDVDYVLTWRVDPTTASLHKLASTVALRFKGDPNGKSHDGGILQSPTKKQSMPVSEEHSTQKRFPSGGNQPKKVKVDGIEAVAKRMDTTERPLGTSIFTAAAPAVTTENAEVAALEAELLHDLDELF